MRTLLLDPGTTTFAAVVARWIRIPSSATEIGDGLLEQHPPRLRDAAEWSAARLANRTWLERAFPAWGDDWAAEQSPAAWVQRCRHLHQTERVRPAVFRLDGRLVGEIGVDALDARTNTGEASAWLVRDHGSPDVMRAATLLLIREAFTGAAPIDRMISPVATTSRRGRAPGLSAVGFAIEATVPRPVGRGQIVDHDIWVVHNTAEVRAETERLLREVGRPVTPSGSSNSARELATLAPALAKVTAREVLARRHRGSKAPAGAGPVARFADVGTATGLLVPAPEAAHGTVVGELRRLAGDTSTWAPGARAVEVALAPDVEWLADDLPALGFARIATFPATPDGSGRYPGEQIWRRDL